MAIQQQTIQSGRVKTEGDELYYEVRGQGKPLLMIAGGGGDAWWYIPVADLLADEFKVILYDRRANARSTMNHPENFDISQESRDAVAVLHAAGEESAYVFGNSSGAVIALDMATTQPQAVRAGVIHEPPLARIHPNAEKWQRFFAGVYSMAARYGASLAALRFALGAGLPFRPMLKGSKDAAAYRKANGQRYISSRDASKFLVKQELLPVTDYQPDVEKLKRNGVRIITGAGNVSLENKRFYAETAPILAEKLGAEFITFPGHHMSFWDMPDEFAAVLRRVLQAP